MLKFSIPQIVQLLAVNIAGWRSVHIKKLLRLDTQRPPLTPHSTGHALAAEKLIEVRRMASAANTRTGQVEAALAAIADDVSTAGTGAGAAVFAACGTGREAAGDGGGAAGRRSGVLVVGADDFDRVR